MLHRIARAAHYAGWTRAEPDSARFCADQYNRVLGRLKQIEPAIVPLFTALDQGASPQVIRMAAHELAAYFQDEVEGEPAAAAGPERGRRARRCGRRVWIDLSSYS